MTSRERSPSQKPKKRLTMADIAKLAGVEKSTVSRALSDSPRLPASTKEKIRKIVKETGYVANHQAKLMRSQKSGQILIMHHDIASLSFPEYVQGIEETAGDLGVNVLVGSSQDAERGEAFGRMLLSGAVDGLILLAGAAPQCVMQQANHERSIVSVSAPIPGSDIPFIAIDIAEATNSAIEHLLSLSHRKIALIAGPQDSFVVEAHINAYREAMKLAGLTEHCSVEVTGGCDIDSGTKAMTRLLASGDKPTAVFCTSDELALGAMKKTRRTGFRIPEDISFVGYGDLALARAMDPPLTSIHAPLREMGRIGAKMLMQNLNPDSAKPENRLLKYELIARESCGPAPSV